MVDHPPAWETSDGGIVMVDGSDERLSGMYGGCADTCTHDDVACDDCVGSDLIPNSICGGATYGAAVSAMRTLGWAIGARRSPRGPSIGCCAGAGSPDARYPKCAC